MNAVITGARRGIGRAVTERFAKEGYDIFACARKEDAAFVQDMSALSETYGVEVTPVFFDMCEEDEMRAGVQQIKASKKAVDVLVNNAGMAYGNLMTMTPMKDLRQVFEVNFFSQVALTQMIARLMMREKHGAIINITSVTGLDGGAGFTAYGASKASMALFTKVAAQELGAYGIRVNAVAPGLIATDMQEEMRIHAQEEMIGRSALQRTGTADEIASLVCFLASDEASYLTGQVVRADGGIW